jgi:hypothetical protein
MSESGYVIVNDWYSFGAKSTSITIERYFFIKINHIYISIFLILLSLLTLIKKFKLLNPEFKKNPNTLYERLFLMGSALYCGLFITQSNYDYKLILIIFCVPYISLLKSKFNKYVGFIGYKKNNTVLVFKSKDMDSSRDTGATCEEAGKDKSIQKLNGILGEEKYTKENTKAQKDADGNIVQEAIGQIELCVLQEFILRYFNVIKKNGKKWFLTPELAIGHKLYKIIV